MTFPVVRFGDLFKPAPKQTVGNSNAPILSITMAEGLVEQAARFKKRIASKDISNYRLVARNQLVVGFPINEGVIAFQKNHEFGGVSPAYGIWDLANPEEINVDYVGRILRSPQMCKRYEAKMRGTAGRRRNLSKTDLKQISFPLPPLPEQKRIAAILDAADALRAKRRESIEQLDSFIQSTFLEMFGDPVTNPKGWDVKSLGELVAINAEMIDPTQQRYQSLLHYGPDRITKDTGELLAAKTAAEDGITSGKFLCGPQHVLYSKIRPYLNKVALVSQECLCSADVYPVSITADEMVKEFLWVLLRSKSFLGFVEGCSGRANIPKINRKEFMSYNCFLPPLDLQTRFASIVESIEQQKTRLKSHLTELDTLFASLQSRAFNGELVA